MTRKNLPDGQQYEAVVLVDPGTGRAAASSAPGASAAAITPSDSTPIPNAPTRGVYVGVTGDVVALISGAAVTFVGVPAGSILPIAATRVNATGTTAASLVALF